MFVLNFAKDSLLVILSLEKHIQAGLREVNKAKMMMMIYLLGDELFLYVPFFCVTELMFINSGCLYVICILWNGPVWRRNSVLQDLNDEFDVVNLVQLADYYLFVYRTSVWIVEKLWTHRMLHASRWRYNEKLFNSSRK